MSALDHHGSVDPPGTRSDGSAVVLRQARMRDLDALISLADRAGVLCEEFELARLIRSHPSERLVLCATTRVDGEETVLGVGVIERDQSATMPTLILVDPAHGRPLAALLAQALVDRARAAA